MAVRSVDWLNITGITDTGVKVGIEKYTFTLTLKYTTDDGVQHTYGPTLQTYPNDLATMPLSAQKFFANQMIYAFIRVSLGIDDWSMYQ